MSSLICGNEPVELAPGAFHLPGVLAPQLQRELAARCSALIDGPVPAYIPVVRGGAQMHVRMLCLGRHWNGRTYQYEDRRSDFDQAPAPELPEDFAALAISLASRVSMRIVPDICIVNHYGSDGRMGLHQDKDESPESLAQGAPIVSISLGDTARFLLGGIRRRDPVSPVLLESGDAIVFGGPARLRFHGVSRIHPGSGPQSLGLSGRINLTFRQY